MTEFIDFGPQGAEPRDTGRRIERRMAKEPCIAISEDNRRSWFWFPGRSWSATAHWWVLEGGTELIGEWVAPSDDHGHRLHHEAMSDPGRPCVFAHSDRNSSLVLPAEFRATLVPNFAWGLAESPECGFVKIEEDMHGQAIWHALEPGELAAKWLVGRIAAERYPPEEFLAGLSRLYRAAEKLGWINGWLHLYLPALVRKRGSRRPT